MVAGGLPLRGERRIENTTAVQGDSDVEVVDGQEMQGAEACRNKCHLPPANAKPLSLFPELMAAFCLGQERLSLSGQGCDDRYLPKLGALLRLGSRHVVQHVTVTRHGEGT